MKEKKDLHSFQSIEAIQKEEPLIGPRAKISDIWGKRALCHGTRAVPQRDQLSSAQFLRTFVRERMKSIKECLPNLQVA